MNHKRLFRVYRAAGLSVKRRKRKRLVRQGQHGFLAERPNQQWSIDFVHDRLANGGTVRVLTVVDTFTRECLALEVDTCLPSRRVTRALDLVIAERGRPERIRLDNGSELTSRHFLSWGIDHRIELHHIEPGKPVQNAFIESFNGRLEPLKSATPVLVKAMPLFIDWSRAIRSYIRFWTRPSVRRIWRFNSRRPIPERLKRLMLKDQFVRPIARWKEAGLLVADRG